jgi:hypothetical protein
MPAALLDHLVKNAYTREVLVRHSLRHNDSAAELSGLPKLPLAGCFGTAQFRLVSGFTEQVQNPWEGQVRQKTRRNVDGAKAV